MASVKDGESANGVQFHHHMRISDRLDLLSALALLWLAVLVILAIFTGVAIAIELIDPSEPEPAPTGEPYYIGPIGIVFLPFVIGIWFGSWGLISLAAVGRETTIRGGHLETTSGDVAVFIIGSLAWNVVLASAAPYERFWIPLAVLPVSILIGVTTLVWRFFTRGLAGMTLGIIQTRPSKN
jgi:hypothetical protein